MYTYKIGFLSCMFLSFLYGAHDSQIPVKNEPLPLRDIILHKIIQTIKDQPFESCTIHDIETWCNANMQESLPKDLHGEIVDNLITPSVITEKECIPAAHASGLFLKLMHNNHLFFDSWGTIKEWDPEQNLFSKNFIGHTEGVHCLLADENYLYSGSGDKTIKKWDRKTATCVSTIGGHDAGIDYLLVQEPYLIAAADKIIKVRTQDKQNVQHDLIGHVRRVSCLLIAKNRLYSASHDKTIRAWDLGTGECLHTLSEHKAGINCLTSDKNYLYSGADDHDIRVWNLDTHTCCRILSHVNAVRSLFIAGNYLIGGSFDTIRLWRTNTHQHQKDIKTGSDPSHFSWCNNSLFFAERDTTIRYSRLATVASKCMRGGEHFFSPLPLHYRIKSLNLHDNVHSLSGAYLIYKIYEHTRENKKSDFSKNPEFCIPVYQSLSDTIKVSLSDHVINIPAATEHTQENQYQANSCPIQ